MGVSNGSFKNQYGTAALFIQGTNDTVYMTRVNMVFEAKYIQSTYRGSELVGLYGLIVAVQAICEH